MKKTLFLFAALCVVLGVMACSVDSPNTDVPPTETPSEEEGGNENEDPDTPAPSMERRWSCIIAIRATHILL